jgi:hypothetical protein
LVRKTTAGMSFKIEVAQSTDNVLVLVRIVNLDESRVEGLVDFSSNLWHMLQLIAGLGLYDLGKFDRSVLFSW